MGFLAVNLGPIYACDHRIHFDGQATGYGRMTGIVTPALVPLIPQ